MKAKARAILTEAKWVPPHALSSKPMWTPKLVKMVLVEARRREKREPRVAPRGDQAFWPGFVHEEQSKEAPKRGFERWMTVDRMHQVIGVWTAPDRSQQQPWLAGPLLDYPELRQKLTEWIKAVLRDESGKLLCERKGWVYTTFCTHRDRAAGIIAQRLNAAGVAVWPELIAPEPGSEQRTLQTLLPSS